MNVKYKKLYSDVKLPTKATEGSAGYDLYAHETAYIPAGETVVINTGFALEIPEGWKGEVYSRSGLASKGLVVANSPGKIDSDYRGEIKIILRNTKREGLMGVEVGDRIAQLEVNPCYPIVFEEVEELPPTKRGAGALGSTENDK